ncbi:MAG: DUF401 family protein [Planctomycetota bacterium]|jgi:hypothetical protein
MADAILDAPVLVKVFAALALILVLNRLLGRLVLSVFLGALVLGLWSGHSAGAILSIAWARLSSAGCILLMLILLQVIWLSSQMAAAGVMEDLVTAVRARVSRRGAVAVLPAVIGLLPMPGGALFSAPLVDSCDTDDMIGPVLKAQTNHWFRHMWEFWWPLYPGVLLALAMTGLEIWQMMMIGMPLTLCSVGAGYVFLLRRIKPESEEVAAAALAGQGPGPFALLLPIVVVIVCYTAIRLADAGLGLLWPEAPRVHRYVPMVLGLAAAILTLQIQRPLGKEQWRKILLSGRAVGMAAVVAAVLVYGAFIEADLPGGQSLVGQMSAEMAEWGIPLMPIIMLLPLVSGLATGVTVACVGASFPIVIDLLGDSPSTSALLSTTVLAYGFGYMGMLLSPVHVCLVVTGEHFKTGVLRIAAGLLKPAAVVLAACVLMHLILR